LTCYLDTQVAIWLAEANLAKISPKALSLIQVGEVRISPMAVVELHYLYEIRRIIVSPQDILVKLNAEIGLTVCDYVKHYYFTPVQDNLSQPVLHSPTH